MNGPHRMVKTVNNARFEGHSTEQLLTIQGNAQSVIREAEAGSTEYTPEQIEVAVQQSKELCAQLVNDEKRRLQPMSSQELMESLSITP